MNLTVANCGALFAIQGQREIWSCNREFDFSRGLNGMTASHIRIRFIISRWGRWEN